MATSKIKPTVSKKKGSSKKTTTKKKQETVAVLKASLKAQAQKEAKWRQQQQENNLLKSRMHNLMAGGFASIMVFGFIGNRLDAHLMSGNLWTVVGVLMGLLWVFYEMLKIVLFLTAKTSTKKIIDAKFSNKKTKIKNKK